MRKQFLFMVLMIISMMASAQTTYETYIKAAKKNKIKSYYDATNAISLTPDGYIAETVYDKSRNTLTLSIISPKGKKILYI